MYNDKTRKLTSLTLMTIMFAGGMTFAVPGMAPAFADGELTVSAQEVGNFAGIQVIEIVVDDPDRSSTDESEGVPNVELNGDDVLMTQGDDGAWYAYVANELAIDSYEAAGNDISLIYDEANIITSPHAGSDAINTYNRTDTFLDGFKDISPLAGNNPAIEADDWPYIQTYEIPENTVVTITYGTGSSAESVQLTYDYDDSKDVSFDRNRYPAGSYVIAMLDDSLLNLSPTANDYWGFNSTDVFYFQDDDTSLSASNEISWDDVGFEEGPIEYDIGGVLPNNIFSIQNSTIHDTIREVYPGQEGLLILRESLTDDNMFVNYDNDDISNVVINSDDSVTGSGTIDYNDGHSIILDTFDGVIEFMTLTDEWLSGIELDLELVDEDRNLNSLSDEDLDVLGGEVPYISIGNPVHLDSTTINSFNATTINDGTDSKVFTVTKGASDVALTVNGTWPYPTHTNHPHVFSYVNFDFTEFGGSSGTFYMGSPDDTIANQALPAGVLFTTDDTDPANPTYQFEMSGLDSTTSGEVYFDILSFGQQGHLVSETDDSGDIEDNAVRINDGFYRFVLEETDDNTAKFEGSVEYIMINQLNVFDDLGTYRSIETADDSIVIIVNDDLDGADAVRVSYNDVGSTGTSETISVQEDANTHSGTITLDAEGYSAGNTITITLTDADLNTDSDTTQIYEIDAENNWIGNAEVWLAQLLFNDRLYAGCGTAEFPDQKDIGLNATSFSFIETSDASGVFEGTIKLPATYCDSDTTNSTTNGVDIEFKYQDYSDASGNPNEASSDASVQSNTGFVELDAKVYPVPIGDQEFAFHDVPNTSTTPSDYVDATPVVVTVQINDADFNISASGEDTVPTSTLEIEISRGSLTGTVPITDDVAVEIDPASGIFEVEVEIGQGAYGELDSIEQGDIITVTYTDPNDASGDENSVTDSATFDLRNGVLQTDKSTYVIGSDAIITLIDPDFNLDTDTEETLSLDLINWDSDAGDVNLSDDIFNAEPAGLRETGPNTGIFQVVIEIPREIGGDNLERGEEIELEYQDNAPAGADFVGDDSEDIIAEIMTSDFGATVELDQKVYTWTDKMYVTVVAPDHNFDPHTIDEIGVDQDSQLDITTREDEIEGYKLVETGPDTGIFTGEVILTGFRTHDADGDGSDADATGETSGTGPTDGKIATSSDDGVTIAFEFSDGDTAQGSALIRWNIGEVQWLEASYPASGTGIMRIIDPDMNLNPESVDTFDVNVWSDTSAGGISLRVTETNEATGIFEGTVFFTTTDASSGSRLAVSEGDTITAEYEDNTLPDPYSTADELDITATAIIGTSVPPLERAVADNLRPVDAFGNVLNTVQVDQQIQLTSELTNGQDRDQDFAYLLQVQDENGVTVSLSWITGTLTPGQSLSPAVSYIPQALGEYTATVFVWQSVDNPTALSPPLSTVVTVNS